MHELIKKILNLPSIHFSSTTWEWLTEFVRSLPNHNIVEFNKKLSTETINLSKKTLENITTFLTIWFDIEASLLHWNNLINDFWNKWSKNPLVSDNLLALTIELLPNQLKILKDLEQKLASPHVTQDNGITDYLLTTFYSATVFKIGLLEKNSTLDKDEDYEVILKVINEISLYEQIKNLKSLCIIYLDYLFTLFKLLLKNKDTETFSYYFSDLDLKRETVMELILNDMEKKTCSILQFGNLHVIVEKYLAAQDILYTLSRVNNLPSLTLSEFSEKYAHFAHAFNKKIDKSDAAFWKKPSQFSKVSDWLDTKSKEKSFLMQAGLFSQQYKIQDEPTAPIHKYLSST